MTMNSSNPDTSSQDTNPQDSQDSQEMTPLDDIISRVDSYIKDPTLVTPETLKELKTELEDLKGVIDSEESQEPQTNGMEKKPSLVIAIGHSMKGNK